MARGTRRPNPLVGKWVAFFGYRTDPEPPITGYWDGGGGIMGGIFPHGTWDMGRFYIFVYIFFCLILESFFFPGKNETDKVI